MFKIIFFLCALFLGNFTFAQVTSDIVCQKAINMAKKDAAKGIYKITDSFLLKQVVYEIRRSDFKKYYTDFLISKYKIRTGPYKEQIYYNSCYSKAIDLLIKYKYGKDIYKIALKEAEILYQKELQTRIDTGFIFTEVDSLAVFKYNGQCWFDPCEWQPDTSNSFVTFELIVEKYGKVSTLTVKDINNQVIKDVDLKCLIGQQNFYYIIKPAMLNGQKVRSKFIQKVLISKDDD